MSLLAFGAVLTVAGIVLAGFGVSIHDHTFDTSVITPGVVAAVGGLLLIGLGLALRVLQRIERALAARTAPRAEPALAAQAERLAPSPPALPSQPQSVPVATAISATAGNPAQEPPAKTPLIARLEATRVIAEADAPQGANPTMPLTTSVDIAVAQVDKVQAARRNNGAATLRMAPRLDVTPRVAGASERPAGPLFDALWPKTERARTGQPASPTAPAVSPQPKAAPEDAPEPPAPAPEPPVAAEMEAVSVLKSGVVEGMAYTLYSDGSIEAQLPQGMLRFGSIAELRNHIERSA